MNYVDFKVIMHLLDGVEKELNNIAKAHGHPTYDEFYAKGNHKNEINIRDTATK